MNKQRIIRLNAALGLCLCLMAFSASAFYNPTAGRWLSRDPIGERGSLNLFEFVWNDPISWLDTDGRISVKACETAISEGLKKNAKAKFLIGELKKGKCPAPAPYCSDCCEGGGGAFEINTTKRVRICANAWKSGEKIIETIVHELVHALDDCKGTKWSNCEQRACSEIRAADYDGGCNPGGTYRQRGESYSDCVKRVATESTKVDPKCSEKDVEKQLYKCMGTVE